MMRKNNGLSLIGVIIAVFVLSMGIIGMLALAEYALRIAAVNQMKLVGANLAQEGIEVMRGIRGSFVDWNDITWYNNSVATGTVYSFRVEYDGDYPPGGVDEPLKINTAGLYQYTDGEPTPFYRTLTMTKVSSYESKLVVEVKWQARGRWHYLTIEDRLWKWW